MGARRNDGLEDEKQQVPQNATTAVSLDITDRTALNEGNRGLQDVNRGDQQQLSVDCAPGITTSESAHRWKRRSDYSARTSALNDSTSTFKKDGTAVIYETEESPVRIIDPAMPMSEESTPGSARMQLFFVLGAVQTLPPWILADSGSVRNLVDETVYKSCLTNPRSGTLETVESSAVTANPST